MRLFTCTNHQGFQPIGVASIIIAEDHARAYALLENALIKRGLDGTKLFLLREVDLTQPAAIILHDGDY